MASLHYSVASVTHSGFYFLLQTSLQTNKQVFLCYMPWKIHVGYQAAKPLITKALHCAWGGGSYEKCFHVVLLGAVASMLFWWADFIKSLEHRALTPESLNTAERLRAGACLSAHSLPEAPSTVSLVSSFPAFCF